MNQVVAHFIDGRVAKGATMDLDPVKPTFHLRAADGKAERIELRKLKAIFFVRSFEGDPKRDDARTTTPDDSRLAGSAPITVRFADKESIVGLTNRYPPNRPFFFIVPVDPASNNIRILINKAAVVSMESGAK